MNKTIIDAVNELRGDIDNSRNFFSVDKFLYWCGEDRGIFNSRAKYVCTVEKFRKEVSLMGLNYGETAPILVNRYLNSDKSELEEVEEDIPQIDWSRAPEGTTDYSYETEVYSGGFYKIIDEGKGFYHDGDNWLDCSSWPELIKRPELDRPKLIFTQEMYDNGELPSIGMECLAVYSGLRNDMEEAKVTIAHINDKGQFACIENNGDYFIQYISEDSAESFKPLPPQKTDREILFDQINAIPRMSVVSASKLVDNIINGELHDVTWGKL